MAEFLFVYLTLSKHVNWLSSNIKEKEKNMLQLNITFLPPEWSSSIQQVRKGGEDSEKKKPFYPFSKNVYWLTATLKNTMEVC